MGGSSTTRQYGSAIAIVSGLYAIAMSAAALLGMSDAGAMDPLGIGGWVMLGVGVAALFHGILLLTPVAMGMGLVSGPLMLAWSGIMLGNQLLMATVANWGMAGSGMGDGMDATMNVSMDWDPGMVAIAILMLVSGLIMTGRGPASDT
ncbi:hypothetical protein BH24CHL10_BH24CHL10_08850 [soil metagenome]